MVNNENLLRKVVATVEKQHMQQRTGCSSKEKELLVIIDHPVDKYIDSACKYNVVQ